MPRRKKYDKVGRPPNHAEVYIVELDESYPTYEAAANRVGGDRGCVYKCLIGERLSHKGFTFEWADGTLVPKNPLHCRRRRKRNE